ncbi:hypothetical protein P153DRAFT_350970 [Dothidotthia symphoricarpi CBS 119687]|uniref:F-box domain-containing protein n=1 Tax=Dothidotthia symphoricarpi CBS 119687 TaxID=1392245 RepID=A0A6A5ZYT2_9PLEO|nr:uncharacterized protein P153DRAFT_350970 [Dothidotthia symphoricarpi CBS 119687]KAF2124175.1 hypothetical protein P153DRAFT_350970 [Dothidotthia symphoricarpi CBS 119687]
MPELPCRILDLPSELVEEICSHLDDQALLEVRYVCHALKNLSTFMFGTCFFQCLTAILHPRSLTNLLEIASHPTLSRFVHIITISGERIGHTMNLSGHENEDVLHDLQTSMEESGMDRMILTEVFRKLSLTCVRIDEESFYYARYGFDAVLCGRKHFIAGNDGPNSRPRSDSNRAFDVVFTSLKNAGVQNNIRIQLAINTNGERPYRTSYFDPSSEDWNSEFAANVEVIDLCTDMKSSWLPDLLHSTHNLEHLAVKGTPATLQLSHPTHGLFTWPKFHTLKVDNTVLDTTTFVHFLGAHLATLSSLQLEFAYLTTGTWQDPFCVIKKMAKLNNLYMHFLHEELATPDSKGPFDLFDSDKEPGISEAYIFNDADVVSAVSTILSDFRSVFFKDSPYRAFVVDLRLAYAVVGGRVELHEGKWRAKAREREVSLVGPSGPLPTQKDLGA